MIRHNVLIIPSLYFMTLNERIDLALIEQETVVPPAWDVGELALLAELPECAGGASQTFCDLCGLEEYNGVTH